MINSFDFVVWYDVEVASPPNFKTLKRRKKAKKKHLKKQKKATKKRFTTVRFFFSNLVPFFLNFCLFTIEFSMNFFFLIWKLFNDETLRNLFIVALWYKQLQLFSLDFFGWFISEFFCLLLSIVQFFLWFSQLFQNELDPVLYDSSCRFYKWVIKGHRSFLN